MIQTGSISYQDQQVHYELIDTGDSKAAPILLLGGVLQDRRSWDRYIQDISPVHALLNVDLPGIGDGGILDASFGFDFLAECIYNLLQHLGIAQLNIFATSYSSIIAYEFSAKYTSCVDQLVISSSMASLPAPQKAVMQSCIRALESNDPDLFFRTFVQGVCHPGGAIHNYTLSRKIMQRLVFALTARERAQFIENTRRVMHYRPPESSASKIDLCPLLFTGAYDVFTPPDLCRDIGKYYAKSYFGTIDHFDHLFHIGNRKAIIGYILPFFRAGILPSFIADR